MGKVRGIGATELQRNRVLFIVESQVSFDITVDNGSVVAHLGINPRALTQQPPEITAMTVGPVHTGGGAKAPWIGFVARVGHLGRVPELKSAVF